MKLSRRRSRGQNIRRRSEMRSGIRAAVPVIKRRPAVETAVCIGRYNASQAAGTGWPYACIWRVWRCGLCTDGLPLCAVSTAVLVVRLLAWLELTACACMCVPACRGWLAQPSRRMHDYRLTLPVPFRPYLRRTGFRQRETRHRGI